MKPILIVLTSILGYHYCCGYPLVQGKIIKDFPAENSTAIEYVFDRTNETASNKSLSQDMHEFAKEVVNKVKEGIKTIEVKLKDGFDNIEDKVKDGFDKVMDEIKSFKDNIGSKGSSRGGYYRNKYNRDDNRDRHNRDYEKHRYNKDRSYSSGSGFSDPNAKWVGLGIGIFMLVLIGAVIIYFICKVDRD